jgi:hypothetical protein
MTSATTPLTYNGYVSQIATMAVLNTETVGGVVVGVDEPFNAIIPQMLNYAELRIQRDLDLLPSLVTVTSSPTTGDTYTIAEGATNLSVPTSDFVTIQTIAVVIDGVVNPLLPTTKEYLQNVFGDPSYTGVPFYFAMLGGDVGTGGLTTNLIRLAPRSNGTYNLGITGTVRLATLYQFANSANASTGATFISTYLPDLLIMASMIYLSAYQRNFGDMGNDPAMPGTYENQYQTLLKGASIEEARKKFNSAGWTSLSPAPVAAIPR